MFYETNLKDGNTYRCLECGAIFIEKDAGSCLKCDSILISNEIDEYDEDYIDFLHQQELQDLD